MCPKEAARGGGREFPACGPRPRQGLLDLEPDPDLHRYKSYARYFIFARNRLQLQQLIKSGLPSLDRRSWHRRQFQDGRQFFLAKPSRHHHREDQIIAGLLAPGFKIVSSNCRSSAGIFLQLLGELVGFGRVDDLQPIVRLEQKFQDRLHFFLWHSVTEVPAAFNLAGLHDRDRDDRQAFLAHVIDRRAAAIRSVDKDIKASVRWQISNQTLQV